MSIHIKSGQFDIELGRGRMQIDSVNLIEPSYENALRIPTYEQEKGDLGIIDYFF